MSGFVLPIKRITVKMINYNIVHDTIIDVKQDNAVQTRRSFVFSRQGKLLTMMMLMVIMRMLRMLWIVRVVLL